MKRLAIALLAAFLSYSATAADPIRVSVETSAGTIALTLEIAATPEARATGLMHRQTLAPNDGMLFLFPRPARISFWMKNTPLSLDILFIGADDRVAHIAAATEPLSLTPIDSMVPTNRVIELAAGHAKRAGIAIGDRVTFTKPEGLHVD